MSRRSFGQLGRRLFLSLAFVVTAAPAAVSQTSTGSIRGYVTDSGGTPIAGARVTAVNTQTSAQREVTTQSNGFYALLGLVPTEYEVTARQIGMAPQKLRVRVLIGEVFPLDLKLAASAIQVEGVSVVAAASGVEMRTSEIATNVTQQQIERLPTASRNFLDLAALAPGVTISDDKISSVSRTFTAGGQTANTVNVFVDGTSLKNDLTGGGVTGQDASKGNPFPRSAIQEYRVISQNFKAEYQKASSAIITATTKSGGNQWHGNALFGYQNKGLVALDTFQRALQDTAPARFTKPDYNRSLVSLSLGGPIQRDRLFFFGAYEGNYQNRNNFVNFATPRAGFPALDTVSVTQYNGNFGSPFRESMVFGKLNYTVDPKSSAELSFSTRHETDVRDFGSVNCQTATMCALNEAVNFAQDISIGQLRYNRFAGAWLNEAKVDYSRFRRNPVPNTPGLPARVYTYRDAGGTQTDNYIGSNLSIQDFTQKRLGFRDDLTYSRGGEHVFKTGVSVDFVTYDVFKGNDVTPRFAYRDTVSGVAYDYRNPYELKYGTGNASLNKNNQEIGAYLQDDWSPTPRLTINVGVRWDFETKMMNYDYVTPQDVVDTLTRYHDSLPTKLDPSRFISTGSERKPFYGAFQPRVGFSYALDPDNKTTVFGGVGIYYDRTLFDISVDETLKLSHPTYTINFAPPGSTTPGPGQVLWNDSYLTADKATLDALVHSVGKPEAWLIDKDLKIPKSYQWNLGLRRLFGTLLVSAAYAGVRGVDQLAMNFGSSGLKPDGTCCVPDFNLNAHGFSNFIYSTNDAKTWYDALQVTIDRPYRRSSENFGWGGGLAYTYATRSVQGQDNLGDLFDFPNAAGIVKHPANDEKSRLVANWTMDVPYAFGIQFSGLITLGSGSHRDSGGPPRFNPGKPYVPGGFTPPQYSFIIPDAFAYRTVDVRLRKDFPSISGTTLGVTLDVFNVFNYSNFDYDNFLGPNPKPKSTLLSDPRRAQFGVEYNF